MEAPIWTTKRRDSWAASDEVRESEGEAFMGLMMQQKTVEGRGA